DQTLSSQIFDNYLKNLDNQRVYFLESDIQEFEKYRNRLDVALKSGQLDGAFAIYNRFQTRVVERLQFLLDKLDKDLEKLDLNSYEDYLTDREGQPWDKPQTSMDQLWTKRHNSAVLNLKLYANNLEAARDTLSKRYQSQLNRTLRTNSEDV